MKNKLILIGMAGMLIFAFGCNKDKKPLLEKAKSREQAETAIKEVEKLEKEMQQVQDLERLEKESEKVTHLQEPPKPLTEK